MSRKKFSTTIKEDYILLLKKKALELGVGANDILEFLIYENVCSDDLQKRFENYKSNII